MTRRGLKGVDMATPTTSIRLRPGLRAEIGPSLPQPPPRPEAVWINPPKPPATEDTRGLAATCGGVLNHAVAMAQSLRDVPLQVTGTHYLGLACLFTGDYLRAEELLLKVLQLLEGELSRERLGLAGFPAVLARGQLTWVFADRGKFKEGTAHGQEGLRLADALDHPYSLATVCWHLAYLHIIRGEFSHAVRLLERGMALSREWNLPFHSVQNAGSLGYASAALRADC